MAQIRIDADKEERMIAQILRDEKKLLPAEANALATNICRRLTVAIPTPTNPPLQGYRIIRSSPPDGGDEFIAAHAEHARCHAVPSNLVASVGSVAGTDCRVSVRPQRAVIGRSQRYHGRVTGWRRMIASGIVMFALPRRTDIRNRSVRSEKCQQRKSRIPGFFILRASYRNRGAQLALIFEAAAALGRFARLG